MKIILLVNDGMSDQPCKDLGGKTPLEEAKSPNLDALARLGMCGIMDPIKPGVPPGSDTAHLAIFGYDPFHYYSGRGPFEVLGCGGSLKLQPGDIAFRANFATVNEDFIVLDRRAGRNIPEAKELVKLVDGYIPPSAPDVNVYLEHTVEHRLALLLRGPGLSPRISDVDLGQSKVKLNECKALEDTKTAVQTAQMVNEFVRNSYDVLSKSPLNKKRRIAGFPPANVILLRGAGMLSKMQSFGERYNLKASFIAGGALYKGIARALGMQEIPVPEATGKFNTNTLAKGRAVVANLKENDFIFCHVKATDSMAHDHDPQKKIEMIEKIDKMVGYILKHVSLDEVVIALTADHTTACSTGKHTADPPPIAITSSEVINDDVVRFTEKECAKGRLGRILGVDVMPILLDIVGKTKKFGA